MFCAWAVPETPPKDVPKEKGATRADGTSDGTVTVPRVEPQGYQEVANRETLRLLLMAADAPSAVPDQVAAATEQHLKELLHGPKDQSRVLEGGTVQGPVAA